ncbi:anaerobic ribonucleoside-triphosphate reductase activating protein [Candidatus Pacearchaeota archaeon]|nr:anaerobic ribonucleoside-triphosphate reductase activating protein [Candidatus Pacearchaeota archaeon]
MLIKGLQKTTLIDYPGKVACTIFLFGCNFRCGYCHNPELVATPENFSYSENAILDFLEKRKRYLEGVCITGGEPLMNIDLEFLRKIKNLGYKIKLDTNGSFPEKLKKIIEEELVDYIAMDIKASKENYEKVVNSNVSIEKIEESIAIISDFPEHEFRTTIVKRFHNAEEIKKIMIWLNEISKKKDLKYYLQGFKNSGKLLDSGFSSEKNVDEVYLLELKKICEPNCKEVIVRV